MGRTLCNESNYVYSSVDKGIIRRRGSYTSDTVLSVPFLSGKNWHVLKMSTLSSGHVTLDTHSRYKDKENQQNLGSKTNSLVTYYFLMT